MSQSTAIWNFGAFIFILLLGSFIAWLKIYFAPYGGKSASQSFSAEMPIDA
jgi:ribosomal protein L16/L10AE